MEDEAEIQLEVPEIKERKWWIAGLLSILRPGLGQIYNGQMTRGIILFLFIQFIQLMPLVFLVKYPSFLFLGVLFGVSLFIYIFVMLDAVYHAHRIGDSYQLKPYNKIFVYISIFIMAFLITKICSYPIKTYVVQAYKIRAGSMEPTLLIGDHILVNKLGNAAKNPQRDDLIVFKYPQNPKDDFIKRVVGIGGDIVEIRDKELYVNNELIKKDYAVHKDTRIIPREFFSRDYYGPVMVPLNSYFVLGNNRDNSMDSRFYGFIKKDKVKGIAKIIYFSWDKNRNSVRWERIGQRIS